MVKILGRIIILALICSGLSGAQLTLKLTTLDGAALKEAGAGQPFLLHVFINNASNTAQYPLLKNVENFNVKRNGFQMNMVNGRTSVSYQHYIRIDEPGTYTLGPAQITEDSGVVESEPITVVVASEQKATELKKQEKSKTSFLRMTAAKTSAFVGQAIPVTLTFYTTDPSVVLQSLIEPDQNTSAHFTSKHKEGPKSGTQFINGIEHRYAQWNWDIYPTKPGTCIIPAYAIDYLNQNQAGVFSYFFSHNSPKRVYGNTLSITVEPLPSSHKAPAFIGTIKNFTAKIEPAHSRVGQGMLLTLTLTGKGDFETVNMLSLLNIPAGLTWYDSQKSTLVDTIDRTEATHRMEYIVQGIQPGEYQIPPQELFYFDDIQRIYKKIKTTALPVHITGTASSSVHEEKKLPEAMVPEHRLQDNFDDIAPVFETFSEESILQRTIPWRIFWPLMGLILLAWLCTVLVTTHQGWLYKKIAPTIQKNNQYSRARTSIKEAHRAGNYAAFYPIMMNLIAQHCSMDPALISPEFIQNFLRDHGLAQQAIEDWNLFYLKIAESGFYKQSQQPYAHSHLTEQALYWIGILEKLPRRNS